MEGCAAYVHDYSNPGMTIRKTSIHQDNQPHLGEEDAQEKTAYLVENEYMSMSVFFFIEGLEAMED